MNPAVLVRRLTAAVEEACLASWRRKPVMAATIVVIGLGLTFPGAAVLSLSWASDLLGELSSQDRIRLFLASAAGPIGQYRTSPAESGSLAGSSYIA